MGLYSVPAVQLLHHRQKPEYHFQILQKDWLAAWDKVEHHGEGPTQPLFIQCFADNSQKELQHFYLTREVALSFSFLITHCHCLWSTEKNPYPQEVGASVQRVMAKLAFSNIYLLVWQCKVVFSAGEHHRGMFKRGCKNNFLMSIAFTSNHIKMLHKLNIECSRCWPGNMKLRTRAQQSL